MTCPILNILFRQRTHPWVTSYILPRQIKGLELV